MEYRVSYEHSLVSRPDEFIACVGAQVIRDVPEFELRDELLDFIGQKIRQDSPLIGEIRNLRIL